MWARKIIEALRSACYQRSSTCTLLPVGASVISYYSTLHTARNERIQIILDLSYFA